jgi:hypothetical protein
MHERGLTKSGSVAAPPAAGSCRDHTVGTWRTSIAGVGGPLHPLVRSDPRPWLPAVLSCRCRLLGCPLLRPSCPPVPPGLGVLAEIGEHTCTPIITPRITWRRPLQEGSGRSEWGPDRTRPRTPAGRGRLGTNADRGAASAFKRSFRNYSFIYIFSIDSSCNLPAPQLSSGYASPAAHPSDPRPPSGPRSWGDFGRSWRLKTTHPI